LKPAKFDYEKPRTLADAVKLLAAARGEAKPIAGGQSLGPMLNFRLAQPALLVDVRGLPELAAVSQAADSVTLGGATTHAAIEDGRVPDPTNGLLRTVARGIAYRAVRNRGTLGGSLAHADPAADWLSVMTLLDAEIVARGANGERRVRAPALANGPLSTVLGPDEIITGVRLPKLSAQARWSYYKVNRKPGEFAEAIAAFVVDPARGLARGVIGAAQGAPVPIDDARPFTQGAFDSAAAARALAAAGFDAGTYEFQVHLVALRRAAAELRA
jgi:carbon-monoxide dehydrogenase medium subunit